MEYGVILVVLVVLVVLVESINSICKSKIAFVVFDDLYFFFDQFIYLLLAAVQHCSIHDLYMSLYVNQVIKTTHILLS